MLFEKMKNLFFTVISLMFFLATDGVSQTIQGKPLSYWSLLLKDSDPGTRRMAAYNLGNAGPACVSVLPDLNEALRNQKSSNDPDLIFEIMVAEAILKIDRTEQEDEAVDFLIGTVESQLARNTLHNDNAIEALGFAGRRAKKAVPLLTQIVNAPSSGGSQLAAETALSRINGK
jgi:HEAT repeat protein